MSSLRHELQDKLNKNGLLAVVGPTGCGKSTQIPPLIMDLKGHLIHPVTMTLPRRIAVKSLFNSYQKSMAVEAVRKLSFIIYNFIKGRY
jgi:HrpA-like RNA helicase